MHRRDEQDWRLFTSTVLLMSSTTAIAREELDILITAGTNHDHDTDDLRRARAGVAALAGIANHYNQENADEPKA